MKRREKVTLEGDRIAVVDGGLTRLVEWSDIARVESWCWPFSFDEVFLAFVLADQTEFAIGEDDPQFQPVSDVAARHFAFPADWRSITARDHAVLWPR